MASHLRGSARSFPLYVVALEFVASRSMGLGIDDGITASAHAACDEIQIGPLTADASATKPSFSLRCISRAAFATHASFLVGCFAAIREGTVTFDLSTLAALFVRIATKQRAMFGQMFSMALLQLEVLGCIVRTMAVFVMHDFIGKQWASKRLRHDVSVFFHALAVHVNVFIAIAVHVACTVFGLLASDAPTIRTIQGAIDATALHGLKRLATVPTMMLVHNSIIKQTLTEWR